MLGERTKIQKIGPWRSLCALKNLESDLTNPINRNTPGCAFDIATQEGKGTASNAQVGTLLTSVAGVTLHNLHTVSDTRGCLSVGEFGRDVPFPVSRYFLVYGVPSTEIRGQHAHFRCHQFLVATKGSVHVTADDGGRKEEFVLDRANKGIYLPPMIWGTQFNFSSDAVLLVFASDYYDDEDYVKSYEEFLLFSQEKMVKPGD